MVGNLGAQLFCIVVKIIMPSITKSLDQMFEKFCILF